MKVEIIAEYNIEEGQFFEDLKGIIRGQLIRCKDCKWRNHPGCALMIVDDSDRPGDNDYCSFAERKEGK